MVYKLKCGAKRRTSISLAQKNPCGARNSVCLFVCLFVCPGLRFLYGELEVRELMFLGVIGPEDAEFFVWSI